MLVLFLSFLIFFPSATVGSFAVVNDNESNDVTESNIETDSINYDISKSQNETDVSENKELMQIKQTESFAGGSGTKSDPYQIETAEQLDLIRNDLAAYYILMNDITFSTDDFSTTGRFYNDGKGWCPIGTAEMPFTGALNGNKKTISGIYLNADLVYAGLFGYISHASIYDLSIQGELIVETATSEAYVGAIAGYNNMGTISGCINDSSITTKLLSTVVSASHYVGGIVGYNNITYRNKSYEHVGVNNENIFNCSNINSIKSENENSWVGGIAGWSSKDKITDSPPYLPDHPLTSSDWIYEFSYIKECTNGGLIGGKNYVGGIAGEGNCAKCDNKGNVENTENKEQNKHTAYIAGITGLGECTLCSNEGRVSVSVSTNQNDRNVGGICGGGKVYDSSNNGIIESVNDAYASKIRIGGIIGSGNARNCRNYGSVSTFHSRDTNAQYAGGISGQGSVDLSSNSGNVENIIKPTLYYGNARNYSGGIVGSGTAQGCFNIGAVSGFYAGGIVGSGDSGGSYNVGTVSSVKGHAGGIAGIGTTIEQCYNVGSVYSDKGDLYAGGLLGSGNSVQITDSYYLNRIDYGVAGDQYVGVSCSIEELRKKTTYKGFNFEGGWSIDSEANYSLPILNYASEVLDQRNIILEGEISGMDVTGLNDSYEYTGEAIEPEGIIEGLTNNKDYVTSFSDNKELGVASITYRGIGSYFGTINKTFRIVPKNISSYEITGFKSEYAYTGSEIKPDIVVTGLNSSSDYDVNYVNNVDCGTATITVSGKGNYTGEITAEFIIYKPIDISGMSFSGLKESYLYSGEAIVPSVSINGLEVNKDYEILLENNVNAGTATIKAVGKVHYTGCLKDTFIIEPIDVSDFEIVGLDDVYCYTGKAITPSISIEGLSLDKDYQVDYKNNVDCGTATMTVSGIGNYKGEIKKYFTIVDGDISKKEVVFSASRWIYSGSEVRPRFTIEGLEKNKDYRVDYKNNINAGTAEMTIWGIGLYYGQLKKTFEIMPAPIIAAEIQGVSDKPYTGNFITQNPVVYFNGILVEGKDYTVDYENNRECGNANIIVTGKGNYCDKITKSFVIYQTPAPSPVVTNNVIEKTPTLKAVKIGKPKAGKKSATIKWKKISKKDQKLISGIEIEIATDSNFTNIIKAPKAGKKKTSKKVKGLTKGVVYYVRVRAYKGNEISSWSGIKSVKVK